MTEWYTTFRLEYKPDIRCMCSSNVPVHLHAVSESISTSGQGHSDGQGCAGRYEAGATRFFKFHPRFDTLMDATGQVQTYTLVGPEEPTVRQWAPRYKGRRPEDRAWGKSCKLLGRPALRECACVPGLLLPGFRSPCLCRLGVLLWGACCAAWLCCRFRCARLRSPLFSSRLTGTVPRTGKSLGSPLVYFTWQRQSRNFPKEGVRKKCRSTMKIQQHVTDTRAPVACWMLPCSKQGEDNDDFPMSFLRSSKQGKNHRYHHFQVSLRTEVTLRCVEEGMALPVCLRVRRRLLSDWTKAPDEASRESSVPGCSTSSDRPKFAFPSLSRCQRQVLGAEHCLHDKLVVHDVVHAGGRNTIPTVHGRTQQVHQAWPRRTEQARFQLCNPREWQLRLFSGSTATLQARSDIWFAGSSQCVVSQHGAFKKNCRYA